MNRLYRIYNLEVGEYGKPFPLCDKHHAEWIGKGFPRGTLVVEKIADTTDLECNHCERGRAEEAEEK